MASFIKLVVTLNGLHDAEYVEPYAGGASVALTLLYEEYARRVHINDKNRSVHAFWKAALDDPERFCLEIRKAPMSMAEWHRQKARQTEPGVTTFELGFSTFYLNRTNRSGIIRGGVIGGKRQDGKWKMDARFNREPLVERVLKLARFADRISLTNIDAEVLLAGLEPNLPPNALLYLDPPYVAKGSQLYEDSYGFEDHERLASTVQGLTRPWMVSYDYDPRLLELYQDRRCLVYGLSYHAQQSYKGREIIFFSDDLEVPQVGSPAGLTRKDLARLV